MILNQFMTDTGQFVNHKSYVNAKLTYLLLQKQVLIVLK